MSTANAPVADAKGEAADRAAPAVVLDTNIVLDVFVFSDAAALPLRQALADGALRWIATAGMRDELATGWRPPMCWPRLTGTRPSPQPQRARRYAAPTRTTSPSSTSRWPSAVRC